MLNASLLLLLAAAPLPAPSPAPPAAPAFARTREVVYAAHGMVAAAQPLAVQAGVDVLKQGGSAVDAAIATNAALALMEPTSCGPGGDLFAILWDPKAKQVVGLDAAGRSPKALTADKVTPAKDGTIPLDSPATWTVPGAVDGWFTL
ncbi:MAG TPA: gamma-glutamyltransferase, partial [Myxococcaceae bacterium]